MSSIQLELLTNHPKSFLINWSWTNSIRNQLKNRSINDIKTILKIFSPSTHLMRTIDLSNTIENRYKLTDITIESELKVCVNITVRKSYIIPRINQENCTNYYNNKWSLPIATMLAAFLVFTLIVALIFMAKRIGKNRRKLLIKKSSKKRSSHSNSKRGGDSYVLIYPAPGTNDNDIDTDNEEQDGNVDNNFELNHETNQIKCQDDEYSQCDSSISTGQNHNSNLNSEIDIERNNNDHCDSDHCDSDNCDGDEDCHSNSSSQPDDEEDEDETGGIVKCDCGLIHLVGTELECDSFLNDPCSYLVNNQETEEGDEENKCENNQETENGEKTEAL